MTLLNSIGNIGPRVKVYVKLKFDLSAVVSLV